MALAFGLAVALVAAAPLPATPAASAKRFVDRLYGLAGPPVPERQMYTPDLARLIARAEAVARRTDDPDLVGDALCDCQDLTELRARTVVAATPSAAAVRLVLTGGVDGPARFLGSIHITGPDIRSHDCHPRRWPSLLLRWPIDQRSH